MLDTTKLWRTWVSKLKASIMIPNVLTNFAHIHTSDDTPCTKKELVEQILPFLTLQLSYFWQFIEIDNNTCVHCTRDHRRGATVSSAGEFLLLSQLTWSMSCEHFITPGSCGSMPATDMSVD